MIQKKIAAHKRATQGDVLLLLYYSGHVRKEHLLLGASSLSFVRLHALFRATGATLRLGVFDACESGALTRIKGLRRQPKGFPVPFVNVSSESRGEVILTATGEQENAHEDADLKGGIFTHFLASGLRGAADQNKDGYVTLEEAYRYVYSRSLQHTMLSSHGPQRARFLKKLSGQGSFVLASLSSPHARLLLPASIQGQFFVWNKAQDTLLAEFQKSKGESITIALPPGDYHLRWREGMSLFATQVKLSQHGLVRLSSRTKGAMVWRKMVIKGAHSKDKIKIFLQKNWIHTHPLYGVFQLRKGYHFFALTRSLVPEQKTLEQVFRGTPEALQESQKFRDFNIATISTMSVGITFTLAGLAILLFAPDAINNAAGEFDVGKPTSVLMVSLFVTGGASAISGLIFSSMSPSFLSKAVTLHNARIKREADALVSPVQKLQSPAALLAPSDSHSFVYASE